MMQETADWQDEARRVAYGIRRRVLDLTVKRNGCYLSQACSAAEIIATMYTRVVNLGPSTAPAFPPPFHGVPGVKNPDYFTGAAYNGEQTPDRDRLLFSAAHYAVVVYAALGEVGRMDPEALEDFNVDGTTIEMIGGEHSPGMEITTGSFGQAVSQAGGIALGRRLRGETGKVWLFMSDGELEEGQTWEGVQALSFYKIDNLAVYVDVNGQQVDGLTKDVMNIEPISDRLEAFGAKVVTVDGHDVDALAQAAETPHPGQTLFILAYTDPAKGIPLLEERKPYLHYIRFKGEDDKARFAEFLQTM